MSWVDIVVAGVVLVATERGYHLGVLRQGGSILGFIGGFLFGVWIAPSIALRFDQNPTRPLVAAVVVGFCVLIGALIGRHVGAMANLAVRRLHLGPLDRTLGAVFAAIGSIVVCWLVASLMVNVALGSVSSAIANSKILAVVDDVMPPVPSLEARVQGFFRSSDFPSVFAQVVQPLATPVALPTGAVAATEVGADGKSVIKIEAINACGVDKEGTGFVVGTNEVVTAAHVIAGSSHLFYGSAVATVIEFDPNNDVAVLRVSTTGLTPIALLGTLPSHGSPAAVVGYPENGPYTLTRAAIIGPLTVQSRNIYLGPAFTRDLVEVDASVQPGNSGSPLLVAGKAAGLIFSRSVAQSNIAYAVPSSIVAADLAKVRFDARVSSGACLPDS